MDGMDADETARPAGFRLTQAQHGEDVAAVGTVRDACAVFHYQQGQWGTGGKALFNMNAGDAVSRLQGQFVAVGD